MSSVVSHPAEEGFDSCSDQSEDSEEMITEAQWLALEVPMQPAAAELLHQLGVVNSSFVEAARHVAAEQFAALQLRNRATCAPSIASSGRGYTLPGSSNGEALGGGTAHLVPPRHVVGRSASAGTLTGSHHFNTTPSPPPYGGSRSEAGCDGMVAAPASAAAGSRLPPAAVFFPAPARPPPVCSSRTASLGAAPSSLPPGWEGTLQLSPGAAQLRCHVPRSGSGLLLMEGPWLSMVNTPHSVMTPRSTATPQSSTTPRSTLTTPCSTSVPADAALCSPKAPTAPDTMASDVP